MLTAPAVRRLSGVPVPDYFVTVFAAPFASPDEANQWCDAEGFPLDDCFAKRLSDTGSWEDAAVYR